MDFLKLVQKKEQTADNKIIAAMVFLVVLIMSSIVFWPTKSEHHLLTYLPDSTNFYIHWTNKKYINQDSFVATEVLDQEKKHLQEILGSNFFNLQEALWFQIEGDTNNHYLLRFSRLPRSFLDDFEKDNASWQASILEKNIVLINSEASIENLQAHLEMDNYWQDGVTFFWQKDKSPDFLSEESKALGQAFLENKVLFNWQTLETGKNKLSLLENTDFDFKDMKNFMSLKEFDLFFAFQSNPTAKISKQILDNIWSELFQDLSYYNLDRQAIQDRLLKDSVVWKYGDSWLLASDQSFSGDILDFINLFKVEEVSRVLSDGTAYTELVAAKEQPFEEHAINGQKVIQIDQLFLWSIGEQHYLTNDLELIRQLSVNSYHLGNVFTACGLMTDEELGEAIYLKEEKLVNGALKDYLHSHNIYSILAFSYQKGDISGLNICF